MRILINYEGAGSRGGGTGRITLIGYWFWR